MKVISPTGCVHIVEADEGEWGITTLCHHNNGPRFSIFDIGLDWPFTGKEVNCKRCLRKLHAKHPKVTKIIHVNQHVIKHNLKYDADLPPCRIQEGRKSQYCREVEIKGPSRMVYRPNDPLSCGARLWIETEGELELMDEVEYTNIREAMENDIREAFANDIREATENDRK